MKPFQTHLLLCVLLWTVHTSAVKSSVGAHFRSTRNHAGKGRTDTQAQSHTFTAISGNSALQADQATDLSVSPVRRVLKGRRPVQSSNVQPVRKPNVPNNNAVPSLPRQGPQSSHVRMANGTGPINILASFAGKNRVLVISAPHDSDGYYRLMMSLLKPDVYCEMADRHMQQIVMFHRKEEMGGKVRRVNNQGSIVEEPLDPALVPKLMSFLKLEEGKFGMVLLRRTLQVEERYPYPVRLEAVYEVIDQTPMRRHEKVRQKGFVERCKAMGMEGKVVHPVETEIEGSKLSVQTENQDIERLKVARPTPQPTLSSTTQSTTTQTTRKTTTTTSTTKPTTTITAMTLPALTTTTAPTTTLPSTTTTLPTLSTKAAHRRPHKLPHKRKGHLSPLEPTNQPVTSNRQRENTVTFPSISPDFNTHHTDKHRDRSDRISPEGRKQKPIKVKTPKGKNKNVGREQINEHTEDYEEAKPTASKLLEEVMPTKAGKKTREKAEKKGEKKKTKRPMKPVKNTETKPPKASKDDDANSNSAKKASSHKDTNASKPTVKPTEKTALELFLGYFEKKRRLLVITTPDENSKMYNQQRDEYLEQVCDMALRKISIITIFGPLANGTMKIDHYQMEQDKPLSGLPDSDLINQQLITAFRKHLGMFHNDFYMVLTDFDIKVKQQYEVPIIMKAVFDYIDTFSSRLKEMESQRKLGIICKKEDKSRSLENFLSRFRWRRRLLVISAPDGEEWAYQQQLYALNSQTCNLGLRHVCVLKLLGQTMEDIGGVLDLYPINGSSKTEREDLSAPLVRDLRNYFQVSPDYFSMLLVGKDGNVKSWYPSPMWSMSTIYELIDSMQLRRQEMAIQQSLGMRCPEEEYGYHEEYHEGYHRGYGY
ncbi:coiled-coil domain-containing protein 80 [Trichomycterus rosablanca]|uniref:coiled-coil domain-containing protein 80 n=1 Tax=Trichomycterus rosablanca TaxID=2290929 RepID=UPI002F35BFE2